MIDLIMDSGAFGAWRRGEQIALSEYIAYLWRVKKWLFAYVVLDVIPGKDGKFDRSERAVQWSADASRDNLLAMKDAGLSPIPVFHQGESFQHLALMLSDGEPYIGVSPYLSSNPADMRDWLDRCFTLMTSEDGRPYCRTHGFGVTNPPLLTRYPWYSTDSTTWTVDAGYGHIPVPVYTDDGPDYYVKPRVIAVTNISQPNGQQKYQYNYMGPVERAAVDRYLDDMGGFTYDDVHNDPNARRAVYARYYQDLVERASCELFEHRASWVGAKGYLNLLNWPGVIYRQASWLNMRVAFSTLIKHGQYSFVLNTVGADLRLISYLDVRDDADDNLIEYAKHGTIIHKLKNQPFRARHEKTGLAEQIRVRGTGAIDQ